MHNKRNLSRALGLMVGALALLPASVAAQSAPMVLANRTPHYFVALTIADPEPMVSPMDAMHATSGEVVVNPGMSMTQGADASMPPGGMNETDMGMPANHQLEVQLTDPSSGAVVMDVTPTIRITDKSTGVSRDLPEVMGMYSVGMGMSDFHYGQNLYLPDGTYRIRVFVGPDTAEFRDVVVSGSSMMMH